jgi:sec-independent protein translocase protein TatB
MFPEGRLLDFVIVAAVALIVVGPKDLPILMRKVGQFMAKVRGMAAEFRASFEELARQSELDELRREVNALRTAKPLDVATGGVFSDIQAGMDGVHADINAQMTGPQVTGPQITGAPLAETPTPPPTVEPAAAETAPEPGPKASAT